MPGPGFGIVGWLYTSGDMSGSASIVFMSWVKRSKDAILQTTTDHLAFYNSMTTSLRDGKFGSSTVASGTDIIYYDEGI